MHHRTAFALTVLVAGGVASGGEPSVPPPSSITRIAPPAPTERVGPAVPAGAGCPINARVNSNGATLARPQVEPSIASSATGLLLVAGFADFLNSPPATDAAPGVARSINGGHSWFVPAGGEILPNPPGFTWGNRTLTNFLAAGDSAVAWGPSSFVYFSTLGFHDNTAPPGGNCASGGLYVYRSLNQGDSWTLPAGGPAIANTATVFRDKEYIAVDRFTGSPFVGRVYMAWDNDVYSGCPQDFDTNFVVRQIAFSFSGDSAANWSAPIVLASGCLAAPVPAVAANGDVYVVWYDCNVGNRQLVRKSVDGGVSFGPTLVAASGLVPAPDPLIGSNFRVAAPFPSIATDPNVPGNVYVTWSSNNGASQADVFMSRSLNGGSSWSAPLRVNDDPAGNPRDQFFPWIAVGAAGTVRISFGDDRLDLANPGGKLYDLFMAQSTNHGASFGANVRMSSVSSNPDNDGFGGTFIGDYFGLSSTGVPAWDDERDGNQNIYGSPAPDLIVPSQFPTIQLALNNWTCGQTIVLQDGTYTGAGNVNLDFLGHDVVLRSASRNPDSCVIDCLAAPDTRVFDFNGGESPVIEGITIRNGNMHGTIPFDRGGAVHCVSASPIFINCVFEGNGAQFGGAVLLFASNGVTFADCVFTGNTATDAGGAINTFGGGSLILTGCSFSGNSAPTGGAVVAFDGSLAVRNSIFWENTPTQLVNAGATVTVTFSDVSGGWPGAGNIAANPHFTNAPGGNLRLATGSTAIDAADNTAALSFDVTDLDSDGVIQEPLPFDPDGAPRFLDHPSTPDTGNPGGLGAVADMGAYEYVTPPCPWDCNTIHDAAVGVVNFLALLSQWGLSPVPCDFDGGVVGVTDFLALLAHWGPCP